MRIPVLISCTGSGGSGSAACVSCGPHMKRRYKSLTRSRQNVGQVYRIRRGGSESSASADGSSTPCARASRRFRSASSASLRASSTSQPNSSWKKRRLGWMRTDCQLQAADEREAALLIVLTVQSPRSRHQVGINETKTPVLHEVRHLLVSSSELGGAAIRTTILALRDTPTRQWTRTHPPEARACSIHSHARAMTGRSGSLPSSLTSVRSSLKVSSLLRANQLVALTPEFDQHAPHSRACFHRPSRAAGRSRGGRRAGSRQH